MNNEIITTVENALDYFDALPYHPPPRTLETHTGYLLHLFRSNGIAVTRNVARILFPDKPLENNISFSDYYPNSFGLLPRVARCDERRIRATTFYHVQKKLRRPALDRSFLRSSIAPYLRYCPQCLADSPCYILIWRFLSLPGCIKHQCHLLNQCGHCEYRISASLTNALAEIGVCPECKGDLRYCKARRMSKEDCSVAEIRHRDVEFLVTPQPFEEDCDAMLSMIPYLVGPNFFVSRLSKKLELAEVAMHCGLRREQLIKVETDGIGAELRSYMRYAYYLRENLYDVFQAAISTVKGQLGNSTDVHPSEKSFEEKLCIATRAAIDALRARGDPITETDVEMHIDLPIAFLRDYPQVKTLLEYEVEPFSFAHCDPTYQRTDLESEIRARVQSAIVMLQAGGASITWPAIEHIVGVSVEAMQCYSSVIQLEKIPPALKHMQGYTPQRQERENELLALLPGTIADLRAEGIPVRWTNLKRRISSSVRDVIYYPRVQELLAKELDPVVELLEPSAPARVQSEEEVFLQASQAIAATRGQGKVVNKRDIRRILGLQPRELRRYPRVEALLEQAAGMRARDISRQAQLDEEEDELIVLLRQAAVVLHEQNIPISWAAIRSVLGRRVNNMRRYPRASAVVKQLIASRLPLETPSSSVKQ